MNKMDKAARQAEIRKLATLRDDEIDTADIPEAAPEAWLQVRRPGLYRPIKQPVTLRLDADVISWFKDHAQDGGYQTEINRVLRRYVVQAEARAS